MDYEGFLEKTHSPESDGILGECEESKEEKESDLRVLEEGRGISDIDLNMVPVDSDSEIGFQQNVEVGAIFPEKQTGNELLVNNDGRGNDRPVEERQMSSFGVDSTRMEIDPDFDSSPSSKRRKYTIEEKGKAKANDNQLLGIDDGKASLDLNVGAMQIDDIWSSIGTEPLLNLEPVERNFIEAIGSGPIHIDDNTQIMDFELRKEQAQIARREAIARRYGYDSEIVRKRQYDYEIARRIAPRFARYNPEEENSLKSTEEEKRTQSKGVGEELEDLHSPFSMAMEIIKKRNSSLGVQKKSKPGVSVPEFKWVPSKNKGCNIRTHNIPSLLDLSLIALAKNAEAMISLENVPDTLRHKLSQVLCDSRKMNAHFVELLARGSPTEICVKDGSQLTEEEFTKIFISCDTKDLTVLQLDLCGQCMPDHVLRDTLARPSCRLISLATISLKGAYRLSDIGLNTLAVSAPALQSINLSQSLLITSTGIDTLASCFKYTLRELYIDDCQNIDAMLMLPALKKLKHLEVLSVAGIETVCDDFVIGIVEVHGINMKELVFANCVALTDISLKILGKTCCRLCALDLSYLHNLSDLAIQYLANGCRSIRQLKLCRNSFSDEAIAAFLEASGESLSELSLNNISRVGLNTALSLAKCSKNLLSLDLSWCRKVTDEALGLIVDSCSSLRLLKLFGCTQITELFLNGHSNPFVCIVGLKMTPVFEHLHVLEPQEAPLRYSPLIICVDEQSLDHPDT